ncbi:MAG: hypothetical protein ACRELS_20495 [Candidatus Rokuibacteriota bacterium]
MARVRRANFTLPADLLEELRRTVPKGEQSRVVGEALRAELKRRRLRQALDITFGAWKMVRHPELTRGTRRLVRVLRKSTRLARAPGR